MNTQIPWPHFRVRQISYQKTPSVSLAVVMLGYMSLLQMPMPKNQDNMSATSSVDIENPYCGFGDYCTLNMTDCIINWVPKYKESSETWFSHDSQSTKKWHNLCSDTIVFKILKHLCIIFVVDLSKQTIWLWPLKQRYVVLVGCSILLSNVGTSRNVISKVWTVNQ